MVLLTQNGRLLVHLQHPKICVMDFIAQVLRKENCTAAEAQHKPDEHVCFTTTFLCFR